MESEFEKDIDNNTTLDEFQIHSFNDENSQYWNFNPYISFKLGINEEIPIVEKTNKKVLFLSIKKGRKEKKGKIDEYDSGHIHDKYSTDNIKGRIQRHYISFLMEYLNDLLEYFGYKDKFLDIAYQFKKDVSKKYISFLKGITIGELLSKKRSSKFRTYNIDHNMNVYNKVINNPVINKILSEKYITLFKDVYYKNKTIINLKKYGFNKDISLDIKKVKMFEHLLENSTNEIEPKDEEYIKKIIKIVKTNYLDDDDSF